MLVTEPVMPLTAFEEPVEALTVPLREEIPLPVQVVTLPVVEQLASARAGSRRATSVRMRLNPMREDCTCTTATVESGIVGDLGESCYPIGP
jgi:hypothetical protein